MHTYRVYCVTDGIDKYTYTDTEPTTCPTNDAHIIGAVTSVASYDDNMYTIKEESRPTGGHHLLTTIAVDAAANSVTEKEFSWPFDINVLGIEFTSEESDRGNLLSIDIAPDTIIGNITSDVAIGDTVINVSQTVINNIQKGYLANITDGVNTNQLGRVINVDSANNQITLETAATTAFLATTPTYVRMTVMMVDYEFGPPTTKKPGELRIGGAFVAANTKSKVIYDNKTSNAIRFLIDVTYLY